MGCVFKHKDQFEFIFLIKEIGVETWSNLLKFICGGGYF
jgi:hypothetical protein